MASKLTGPFSPFATALRNIRDNLIAKAGPVGLADIQEEYLSTTVNLCIADPESQQGFYEFPAAACWSPDDAGLGIHYSGEYAPGDETSGEETLEQLESISKNIRKRLDGLIHSGVTEDLFDEFPFLGDPTDYPESLRHIQGYWRFEAKSERSHLNFIVFWSYHSIQTESKPINFQNKNSRAIYDALRTSYSEALEELDVLSVQQPEPMPFKERVGLGLSYSILQNILSRIVDEIEKLGLGKAFRSPNFDSPRNRASLRDAFKIVFVRPVRIGEGSGFRYILTHNQIDCLQEQTSESVEACLNDRERGVYRELNHAVARIRDGLEQTALKIKGISFPVIETNQDVASLIRLLSKEDLYLKHGFIEEVLRKAIYLYYAFCDESKQNLRNVARNLVDALEDGTGDVTTKQAFLITQIFASRGAQVVENFINHPFSKHLQYSTNALVGIFENNFDNGNFYPSFLHTFETLALPERLYMYPIFQYDSPLLLSACDANYYAAIQTNFKSILDRNTQGVFNNVIGFELSRTSHLLTEEIKKNPKDEEQLAKALTELTGQRLRDLILHFCPRPTDLENSEVKLSEITEQGDQDLVEVESDYVRVGIPGLSKRLTLTCRGNAFITPSSDGRNALKSYLAIMTGIFSRFFEVRELIESKARVEGAMERSREQYWVQAHEMKKVTNVIAGGTPSYVLDQIRAYFNTFFAISVDTFVEQGRQAFSPEYVMGNSLFELIENGMRVAGRIDEMVSWVKSGNVQRPEAQLNEAAEKVVGRLALNFEDRIIDPRTDKVRIAFFAALVSALRNILKHSPADSDISVFLRERTHLLLMMNKATTYLTGAGQDARDKFSPGQTIDALKFYEGFYNDGIKKSRMHWNHHVGCYVTRMPYPAKLFEVSQ